jgi:hypothetical protein
MSDETRTDAFAEVSDSSRDRSRRLAPGGAVPGRNRNAPPKDARPEAPSTSNTVHVAPGLDVVTLARLAGELAAAAGAGDVAAARRAHALMAVELYRAELTARLD